MCLINSDLFFHFGMCQLVLKASLFLQARLALNNWLRMEEVTTVYMKTQSICLSSFRIQKKLLQEAAETSCCDISFCPTLLPLLCHSGFPRTFPNKSSAHRSQSLKMCFLGTPACNRRELHELLHVLIS